MGSKPDSGPAFPTDDYYDKKVQGQIYGMTLRDWFAGQAFTQIAPHSRDAQTDEELAARYARQAYLLADAMLKEREK